MRHNCVTFSLYLNITVQFCQHFVRGGWQMKDSLSRYTLRVPQSLLDKLSYVAAYEGRSKNKELEQMIIKRIRQFEAEHGKIGE